MKCSFTHIFCNQNYADNMCYASISREFMEHFVPIWISIHLYLLLYSQYKNGQSHVISEIAQPHLTYIKIYLILMNSRSTSQNIVTD